MKGTPQVPCGHCRGAGLVDLSAVYAETLQLLRAHPPGLNGAQLARLAGIKATAMDNRLAALESLGLAESTRSGRQRLWKVRML